MLDLNKRIKIISDLVALDTIESVTYAALECRITIEYLCYERLQIAFDYVSHADLKAWQPGKVVKAIENLANQEVTSSFTLSIAEEPIRMPGSTMTLEEQKNLKYLPIGTQSAIDLRKITSLWQGLSNTGLHVQVPKVKDGQMSIYGEKETIISKVSECLKEFNSIAKGTLLSSSFGPEISIECDGCKYKLKRKAELLKDQQVVSCINPDCDESYLVEILGDDVNFIRRVENIECNKCQTDILLTVRKAEKIKVGEFIELACPTCEAKYIVKTQLVYAMTGS